MSTTLTIRNLDAPVKKKLRLLAASHNRSMEAEARDILARGVEAGLSGAAQLSPQERMAQALASLSGIWQGRGSTDELMKATRGED
jgi:plasmid stability protein